MKGLVLGKQDFKLQLSEPKKTFYKCGIVERESSSSLLLGADVVSNISTEGTVVHEEHLKLLIIPDEEPLKSTGKVELGAEITAETNLGYMALFPRNLR